MKKVTVLLVLMFINAITFAQVSVDELKVDDRGIVFENYTGEYTYRESVFEIMRIGKRLSDGLKTSSTNESRYHLKYSVVHCYDENGNGKFNADIFSIDNDARVEHIRNIRSILASYLISQYGYSKKDATTLAYFITIYNAVYRKNLDYFKSKYKDIVTTHISGENAGLSTKYYEWAGNTKILIPITAGAVKGNISSLNTSELSDKKVLENLKEKPGKGIDERKDLVKLKEKEVAKGTKELDTKTENLNKELKNIVEKENQLKQKQAQVEKKEAEVEKKEFQLEEKKLAVVTAQDQDVKKELEQSIKEDEAALAKEKTDIAAAKEDMKTDSQILEEKKIEAEKKNDEIVQEKTELEKKNEEIQSDKVEIAKDETAAKVESNPEKAQADIEKKAEDLAKKEQTLEEKEEKLKTVESNLKDAKTDPKIMAGKFYYLKVNEYLNGGHYNNEVYIIDALTGKVMIVSPFKDICGKNYTVFPEGVVVIGHKGKHEAGHYLTLLDPDTLDLKVSGMENIFYRSFVEVKDNFIFAVIKEEEKYYLGKFDLSMKMVAKSMDLIFNDTFISFYDKNVYVNGENKEILIFDAETLRTLDKVKP